MDQWLSCSQDLEHALRSAFPLEAERFCLYLPDTEGGDRLQIEETADAFVLVVEAFVYRADVETDGTRHIESIRQQVVQLVSRKALPLGRERFINYLQAVERCLGEQAFGKLESLHPSRWFNAELLEMPGLSSVEDFHRFLAASLPAPQKNVPSPLVLAYVLLDEPRLPDAKTVQAACGSDTRALRSADDVLEFELANGASLMAVLMPLPVPNGEAEAAARLSVARFVDASPMQTHRAHLLVALTSERESSLERSMTLLCCVAAITGASNAVGVYLGSGVAHPAHFFVEQTRAGFALMLLCGVVVVDDGRGRRQLLSRGMMQLGLPELLIKTRGAVDRDALALFFELVTLLARRGEPLPPRDTVGRDEHEKLRVRYEPSPLDATVPVWSVDLV
jgi:hypothetical protein